MKIGSSGGEDDEVVERTISIMRAILSSSSGQISGQCEKPK